MLRLWPPNGWNLSLSGDGGEAIVVSDRERILQIGSNPVVQCREIHYGRTRAAGAVLHGGLRYPPRGGHGSRNDRGTDRRIFEPFARLGNAEAEEGFGLGLSITLALVKLLKGEITVQSLPGAGSTFTVRLPLCICTEENLPPQTGCPEHPARAVAGGGGGQRRHAAGHDHGDVHPP